MVTKRKRIMKAAVVVVLGDYFTFGFSVNLLFPRWMVQRDTHREVERLLFVIQWLFYLFSGHYLQYQYQAGQAVQIRSVPRCHKGKQQPFQMSSSAAIFVCLFV